jgi:hypothetical protein
MIEAEPVANEPLRLRHAARSWDKPQRAHAASEQAIPLEHGVAEITEAWVKGEERLGCLGHSV